MGGDATERESVGRGKKDNKGSQTNQAVLCD